MCCGSPSTETLRSGDIAAVDSCRSESGREDGPKCTDQNNKFRRGGNFKFNTMAKKLSVLPRCLARGRSLPKNSFAGDRDRAYLKLKFR